MTRPGAVSTAAPIDKSRLVALSDGVYAVALTLLALDLKLVPEAALQIRMSDAALLDVLAALAPKALIWLLSFWVGSLFWLAQNRTLHQYGSLDKSGLLIELSQLALVTLLPFSTTLISAHGDLRVAALVYSVHLLVMAALSVARIHRVRRHPGLRNDQFNAAAVHLQWHRSRSVFGWLLVCAVLALIVPGWNMLAALGILLERLPGGRGPTVDDA